MPKPDSSTLSKEAKSSWFAIQDDRRIDFKSEQLKASFEIDDDDFTLRLRATSATANGAASSVVLKIGDILDLLGRHCAVVEFDRYRYDDAFAYASTQAKDPYDTGKQNDVFRLQTARSREKFLKELATIEQSIEKLDDLRDQMVDLADRYRNSSFVKRNMND